MGEYPRSSITFCTLRMRTRTRAARRAAAVVKMELICDLPSSRKAHLGGLLTMRAAALLAMLAVARAAPPAPVLTPAMNKDAVSGGLYKARPAVHACFLLSDLAPRTDSAPLRARRSPTRRRAPRPTWTPLVTRTVASTSRRASPPSRPLRERGVDHVAANTSSCAVRCASEAWTMWRPTPARVLAQVYSQNISTRYSEVHWTMHPPVALPADFVARYKGKVAPSGLQVKTAPLGEGRRGDPIRALSIAAMTSGSARRST